MRKEDIPFSARVLIRFLAVIVVVGISDSARGAGETTSPWPSWRHDLSNTGAAPDSDYPTTADVRWKVDRSDRPDIPGLPAAAGGPLVVYSVTLDPLMTHSRSTTNLNLTEQEKEDLVAFLKTFTDTSILNNPEFSNPFE